ncbi:MAG: lyase family protein, partial [Arsenophonus sp. ET-DL12-MAG3]
NLIQSITLLQDGFEQKANQFKDILKMGRTQLQDAVPMTVGQEFHAFAISLKEEIKNLHSVSELLLEV